ncbi:Metacaspase-1 [Diplonema papillatum]|nr:Metacaspase-1 [Diplonema papillatum]
MQRVAVLGTKETHYVDRVDYEELVKAGQEYCRLLRELFPEGHDIGNPDQERWWEKRMGLSSEEALAVSCAEYRDNIVLTYNASHVVEDGSFTIIDRTVKVYNALGTVIDEFAIRNIKELYHNEKTKSLRIDVWNPLDDTLNSLLVSTPNQALLRSIYFMLLLRHDQATHRQSVLNPVKHMEGVVHRALPIPMAKPASPKRPMLAASTGLEPVAAMGLSGTGQPMEELVRLQRVVDSLHAVHASTGVPQLHPIPAPTPEPVNLEEITETRPAIVGAHRAVLIAIQYPNTKYEIPDAVSKIHHLSDFLCAQGFGGEKVLLSDDTAKAKPTRQNILKSLKWLVDTATPGDSLFLAFAGHGGQGQGVPDNIRYSDENTFSPSSSVNIVDGICPCDYARAGIISGEEICRLLRVAGGVKVTIVSDMPEGGVIMALPWGIAKTSGRKGPESFTTLEGTGYNQPGTAGLVLSIGVRKDSAAGKASLSVAYCRALNSIAQPSAAHLLSLLWQGLEVDDNLPPSPCLYTQHPLPFNFNCSLGAQRIEMIRAEGADRQALQAYLATAIGSWRPHGQLDAYY